MSTPIRIGIEVAPDQIAEALVAEGVSLFTVGVGGSEYDSGLAREWIAWRDSVGG